MAYQCPICHSPLTLAQRSFVCENRHQFDIAKEGYVNLLPANHKHSKDPGDNKAMTQARRAFLTTGHYDLMRQAVAKMCCRYLTAPDSQLLDIGCGEGYYTHYIAAQLQQTLNTPQVYGLDISKIAVRYAAKRYENCQFSVASSQRLPFADNSLNGIVRIYAPCNPAELQRTVKAQGVVITVTPGPRHLYQLRERIYDKVRLHSTQAEEMTGFTLQHEESLSYNMELKEGEAAKLLQMTPFAWKASDQLRQELGDCTEFACEADFILRVYQQIAA